jgi:hypothetical protein
VTVCSKFTESNLNTQIDKTEAIFIEEEEKDLEIENLRYFVSLPQDLKEFADTTWKRKIESLEAPRLKVQKICASTPLLDNSCYPFKNCSEAFFAFWSKIVDIPESQMQTLLDFIHGPKFRAEDVPRKVQQIFRHFPTIDQANNQVFTPPNGCIVNNTKTESGLFQPIMDIKSIIRTGF